MISSAAFVHNGISHAKDWVPVDCDTILKHGWMDDLRFYVLFNSISVISGRWADDNERLVQWNPVYG